MSACTRNSESASGPGGLLAEKAFFRGPAAEAVHPGGQAGGVAELQALQNQATGPSRPVEKGDFWIPGLKMVAKSKRGTA